MTKPKSDSNSKGTLGPSAMFSAMFLWAVVSLVVFFGRSQMLPVYRDLSLELPRITKWLFEQSTLIVLVVITFVTPIIWWFLSSPTKRNIFSGLSIAFVIAFGFVCIYAFFLPLVSSMKSLG